MKRRKTPVYMLIEPDASSRITSRSGFSLRWRLTRLIGTPPWLILPWMVRRRSSRQPRRGGVGLLDLAGLGHFSEIDLGDVGGRGRAFHATFAGAVFRRLVGRG